MRAVVAGMLGFLLASAPVDARPQSACPSSVRAQLRDARLDQASAEADLNRSKDRASAIKAAMEGAFGDVLAECGDVYGEAATACVDRFESQQRAAFARTLQNWLGAEWLSYPEDAEAYRDWRGRGLSALDGERVSAARAGLRALDALEGALNREEAMLAEFPQCPR